MRDMPDGSRQPSIIYNGFLGDLWDQWYQGTIVWEDPSLGPCLIEVKGSNIRFLIFGATA